MNKKQVKHLEEIEIALRLHYVRHGYIIKEMARATRILASGKDYRLVRGLYSAGKDNREHRIFKRDGEYSLFVGWGKSSDTAFRKAINI